MSKEPRLVLDSIWAFPPNRDTLGGTAYLIVENSQNILIDCPSWTEDTQSFLQDQGGVRGLCITHRTGGSPAAVAIQDSFGCPVWVQEQEAYLLPEATVTTFHRALALTPSIDAFWTPGYSPGSSCVYSAQKGGVLFTGRHLLPDQQGCPKPLRMAKTFHWWRQLQSVQAILDRFDETSLHHLCPGANTGFLRQHRSIDDAYRKLHHLAINALQAMPVGL
ncbi:MAG: MBL fold metallo-hydrolase [Thermosynechococcaceae cyanobacterium]